MEILTQGDGGGKPIADAFVRAIRTGHFDTVGPSDDRQAVFYQTVTLASRRLVAEFWSKDCPVELDFNHASHRLGMVATGAGAWFEPVVCHEALAFCVAQIVPADGQRSLSALAEWVRATAHPGVAVTWWDPKFQPDRKPEGGPFHLPVSPSPVTHLLPRRRR